MMSYQKTAYVEHPTNPELEYLRTRYALSWVDMSYGFSADLSIDPFVRHSAFSTEDKAKKAAKKIIESGHAWGDSIEMCMETFDKWDKEVPIYRESTNQKLLEIQGATCWQWDIYPGSLIQSKRS